MWIMKWIFWVVVLFIIIIFVTQNVDFLKESHKLEFLFWETKSHCHLGGDVSHLCHRGINLVSGFYF